MGGFHLFERGSVDTSDRDRVMLHEDDIPLHPLTTHDLYYDDTYRHVRTPIRTHIDFSSFTMPTKAEIKDKGKSDWFAKSLVLLQTSWFVMQCIARGIERLPVTHLEIITLAYAAMNFVIYIFWWNKPLNVNRPIRVFRKTESMDTQAQVTERTPEARKLTWEAIGKGVKAVFEFIAGGQDDFVDLSREDKVPRFWADSSNDDYVVIADLIMLGVGVCFGAIHCVAWIFSFPTHMELLMWRISSVAITAVPIYIFLMIVLGGWVGATMDSEKFSGAVFYFSALSGGILYILSRGVTLVLAFTSLRGLPPGAYEIVHWTTFIPHI